MKKIPIIIVGLFILFQEGCIQTQSPRGAVGSYEARLQQKLRRHFDLNGNGVLEMTEQSLMQTHLRYGWPLARTKEEKFFDRNRDGMLSPVEERYFRGRKREKREFKPGTIRTLGK